MLLYVLLFSLIGVLFIALSIPLLHRRVGPNAWYGLRVPATLADEEIWYEANARSARDLLILGILQLVLALGLPVLAGLTPETYVEVNAAVLGFGAVGAALLGWSRASRLLAEKRRKQQE